MLWCVRPRAHPSMAQPRLDLRSSHLVPTVAVWQLWKILIASSIAGLAGVGATVCISALVGLMSQTTFFNENVRTQESYYERCKAVWDLAKPNTIERNKGISFCYARARQAALSQDPL